MLSLSVCCMVVLTACLDTEERIEIKNDNSGLYSLEIDMSKMLLMAKQMGSENAAKLSEQMDSTIYFKHFIDTARSLSQKEKDMLRDGWMHMKVDEQASKMNIRFNIPFKNISQLPEIRSGYMAILDKLNFSDKINNKNLEEGDDEDEDGGRRQSDMAGSRELLTPGAGDAFLFSAAPGKISNSLDPEKQNTPIMSDSTMQVMQQLSALMGDASYKTVVVLPKPAKKYTGNKPELSADKKTITFNNHLTDLMYTPKLGEFTVEY